MASTRKSSRVRVPKIKEDAATPVKRSKTNLASSTGGTPTTPACTVISQEAVATFPPPATPGSALSIIADPVPFEIGEDLDVSMSGSAVDGAVEENGVERMAIAVFKDPSFVHSSIGAAGSKRTRVWKNLKQIIATERSLPWENVDVTYGSIDGPPSFKPSKKYSDLSGLEAPYTDPQTKIRYATSDEFTRVRTLPSDLVSGYLALRKASGPVP